MKKIFIFLIIILNFIVVYSQKKWTLEECINYALENNLYIKQSKLSTETEKINSLQSKLNLLPNLNASASHNYNWGRNIDPTSNTYTDLQTQSNTFALTSSIDIFNGFQKLNTVKLNESNYNASNFDLEKMKNDISLRIAQAYLLIILNKEQLEVQQNQVNISRLQVERTKKLFEAGTVAKGSLLDMQAQSALEEANLVAAQNQLELSYLELTQLLDLKSNKEFDIYIPKINVEDETTLIPANQAFNYAISTMPEIKSAEYRTKSAEYSLAIARGYRYPNISLSGYFGSSYADNFLDYTKIKSFSVTDNVPTLYSLPSTGEGIVQKQISYEFEKMSFKDQLDKNLSKSLRFSLTIPLFNGYQVNAGIAKAKLNLLNADYNLELAKNQLQKNIEQAYADAQAAFKNYKASQKTLASFQESFSYMQQKFDVGLINSIDYNDSKNKLIKAESDLLRAKYNYIFKKLVLEFYMGNPIQVTK
jgi:outer membrane protein